MTKVFHQMELQTYPTSYLKAEMHYLHSDISLYLCGNVLSCSNGQRFCSYFCFEIHYYPGVYTYNVHLSKKVRSRHSSFTKQRAYFYFLSVWLKLNWNIVVPFVFKKMLTYLVGFLNLLAYFQTVNTFRVRFRFITFVT